MDKINAPWQITKYGSLADRDGVAFANPTSTTSEAAQAKIRLAVVAPDLLAALEEISDLLRRHSAFQKGNDTVHYCAHKAAAVIAKARSAS